MDIISQQTTKNSFGLPNPPRAEDVLFLEEIGAVLLESVLLQYMLALESAARTEFEAWVEAHASADDFLAQVCATYPALELLLTHEIESAKSEVACIVPL